MNNEQILEEAIKKAKKNGLDKKRLPNDYEIECSDNKCWLDDGRDLIDSFTIIFSHDLAKFL